MATNWQVGDKLPDPITKQGRWEIYKILYGGMGVVYVVYDHREHAPLAAKTFRAEIFARDPRIEERFMHEAHLWINLDIHQNITEAFLAEMIEDRPYLFLEYVKGGDLSNWIGTPHLTEDLAQVLRFAIQFCDGMTHALARGIEAHRDIKPQNCLITQGRIMKVSDFGLARTLSSIEANGGRGGTPQYMPPEQWDDFALADVRADIYSFGVVLFEMVTGRLPFRGRTLEEIERQHKELNPPLAEITEPGLAEVIQRCLAKDSKLRFRSFGELRERLAAIYQRLTHEREPQPAVGNELNAVRWNNKGCSLGTLGLTTEELACYERALALDPELNLAWVNKGILLSHRGQHEESLACLERGIELDPQTPRSWYNKGVTLVDMGRVEEAIACFERTLELDPHYQQAWNNKGSLLNQQNRYAEAIACFDHAIAIDPRYGGALSNKANALAALGRSNEALAYHDRALASSPDDARAWLNKGIMLEGLERMEEALACADRSVEIAPHNDAAWNNKGHVLRRLDRGREAVVCFDRAIELSPGDARWWGNKAAALAELGDAAAIACYDRVLALDPRNAVAWYNKGAMLIKSAQLYQEALACFEEAQRLGLQAAAEAVEQVKETLSKTIPTSQPTKEEESQRLLSEGWVLVDAGQASEAIDRFERAIALNPNNERAWFSKGILCGRLGQPEEELVCHDRALEINPSAVEVWVNRGHTLHELGRPLEALQSYQRAIEIDPQHKMAWYSKGAALGQLSRTEEAIACYEQATRIDPQFAECWYSKGFGLSELGRMEEAVTCYARATSLNPDYTDAWFNQGLLLARDLQRFDEALSCLEQAHRLGEPQAAHLVAFCREMLSRQQG